MTAHKLLGSSLLSSIITTPQSVYVHVPFCVHRCGYCDFTLVANRDDLMETYLDCLEIEINAFQKEQIEDGQSERKKLQTLFLGGGTPTHLPPHLLERLFQILASAFDDAGFDYADDAEICIEANPANLTEAKLSVLKDAGVNRVSLGVQSFDAAVLKTLERDHRPEFAIEVIHRVQSFIKNVSVDLIFGVPEQSVASWKATVNRAIDCSPTHISTYGLTFEKGTQFWSRRNRGELTPASNANEYTMYDFAMKRLEEAGFAQYEISSFAKPGYQSTHNQIYWTGRPYWAFGPGAARLLSHKELSNKEQQQTIAWQRSVNHRSLFTWIKRIQNGDSPIAETDTLSQEEFARELLILGLRRCEGISVESFQQQTGFDIRSLVGDRLQDAFERNEIEYIKEDTHEYLRITRAGRFVADSLIVDLI